MSRSRSLFLFFARTTLVLAYLVILAGAVVRATGSGMGCPDWPKCFGHYIPPTELEQLEFAPGKHFNKGHFIIWQRALWKAKRELTAGASIDPADWEKYTKHDYARFNPMHTWTEYMNRLMGALLGFSSILLLAVSFRARRDDRALPWLSGLTVFLVGFEGWLGATVVASNLMPAKITTHMIVALIIVAVLIATIARARRGGVKVALPPAVKYAVIAAMAITIVQVILGTQVREQVDEFDKLWNGMMRETWVDKLGTAFHVHRVLAYGVILLNVLMVYLVWRRDVAWQAVRFSALLVIGLLVLEWITGLSLALYSIPAYIQPVHLVIATVVFGLQFRLWTKLRQPALQLQ
jgi:cytochrome c oxidase assembly protein subunit 15